MDEFEFENCIHKNLCENICVDCGLVVSENNLQSTATSVDFLIKHKETSWKYSIQDKELYIKTSAAQVLEPLNKLEYLNDVLEIIRSIKFSNRMSGVDKVIISTFYLLKKQNYPIIMKDFEPFSKNGTKYNLLMLTRNFPYQRSTQEYIKAVFKRIIDHIGAKSCDISQKDEIENMVLEKLQNDTSIPIVETILSYIFQFDDAENIFETYDLERICCQASFERARKKIIDKENKNSERNKLLSAKLDKAFRKLTSKDLKFDKKIDEVDVYLEERLLNGDTVETLKKMTISQIKNILKMRKNGIKH